MIDKKLLTGCFIIFVLGGFFFRYNTGFGGFGFRSDVIWQAFLGLGYNITTNTCIAIGCRGMGTDYTSGPYTLDVIQHGMNLWKPS